MATKPTVRIPQWANAGSKTDPGTSKENAGWLVSDRPPANWLNWVWGAIGEWMEYLRDGIQFEIAFAQNLTLTTSTPLGVGAVLASHTTYLPGSNKFWHVRNESGVESVAYDSADGITWSAGTAIDPGTPQGCTRPTEDGNDDVYIGTEDEIYKTTTNLASGLTAQTASFVGITRQVALIHSPTYSKFFAAGTGLVESATDAAFPTFSSVATIANVTDLAENPSGDIVATTTGTSTWYSENGTSFTENTSAPTGGFEQIFWNVALGRFVALGGTIDTDVYTISAPGSGTWELLADDVWNVVNLPEGLLIFKQVTADADPNGVLFAFAGDASNDGVLWKSLGFWNSGNGADQDKIRDMGGHSFTGGNGNAVWIRDLTGDYLTYMKY